MMASFMSYFGGRRDTKQTTRNAIVELRQQLQMFDKKEEYLQRKIDEEVKKAKANVVTNKAAATDALKRKKMTEQELERLRGTRLNLEMQVTTLENASFNLETMTAMKNAAAALKASHGKMSVNEVDVTMAEVQEQIQIANEVSEAISGSAYVSTELDEDDLKAELDEMEQEQLDERLAGAERVPIHHPAGPSRIEEARRPVAQEVDEDEEIKQLQAALAM